jgi:phosphoribosylglycinamide formyltransferase-1
MKSIVCLISGRGSNLQALLERARAGDWAGQLGARFSSVISNRAGVGGLDVARSHGVPTQVLPHRDYPSREAFDAALAASIDACAPDLIVLAGFMRVLTPAFVARYPGRLLNIHPALLPAFPGLDTHARALQAGVRLHGSTVHFVSAEVDAGPIVAQSALAVRPGEDADALAARVLALEHALLPDCVAWFLQGRMRILDNRVEIDGVAPAQRGRYTA